MDELSSARSSPSQFQPTSALPTSALPSFNPMGVRGIGEIGITGVSAAIANAVYHATGKRIRSLPMTPDKLI